MPKTRLKLGVLVVAAATAAVTVLSGCSSGSGTGAKNTSPVADTTPATSGSVSADPNAPLTVNAALRAELPQSIQNSGVLAAAGDPADAPVISLSGSTWSGFLPELADQVGQVLGVKVTITNVGSSVAQLLAISAGRDDIGLDGTGDTKPREAQYSFVDYFNNIQGLTVSKANPANIKTTADACGKKFGLSQGSADHTIELNKWCKAHNLPPAIPVVFAAGSGSTLALQSGQVDVSGGPTLSNQYQADHGGNIQVIPTDALGTQIFGIVATKANTGLLQALSGALTELVQDGRYLATLTKWNAQSGALTGKLKVGVNLGDQGTQFNNAMAGG